MKKHSIPSDYIKQCFDTWAESHSVCLTHKRKRSTFDFKEIEIEMCPATHLVTQASDQPAYAASQFQLTIHDFLLDDETRLQSFEEILRQLDALKEEILDRLKVLLPSVQAICICLPSNRSYSLLDKIEPPKISLSKWIYSYRDTMGSHCWYFGRFNLQLLLMYRDDNPVLVIVDALEDLNGHDTTLAEVAKHLNDSEEDEFVVGKMYHVREKRRFESTYNREEPIPDVDMFKPIWELAFTSDLKLIVEMHEESIYNFGRFSN